MRKYVMIDTDGFAVTDTYTSISFVFNEMYRKGMTRDELRKHGYKLIEIRVDNYGKAIEHLDTLGF